MRRILLVAFGISGAAALMYEVVWTKSLSFVLGSTVYALSTMLATFMAGLAIGAYFGGKIADRRGNLIFYFGLFEFGIGLFGLLTVPVLYNLPPLYFWMYKSYHLSPGIFFVSQFLLCALIMLIPTTLMGATFPLVSKRITKGMEEMGRKVGDAYSVNTLGAIAGSLAAGFVLIPLVGIKWASFSAAVMNITVGLTILFLSRFSAIRAAGIFAVIFLLFGVLMTLNSNIKHPYASFYKIRKFSTFHDLKAEEKKAEILLNRDYAQGNVIAYRGPHGFLTVQFGGRMEGTAPSDVPNTMMLAALPAAVQWSQKPEDVLLIGLGTGITLWTGKQLFKDIDVVEINPGIVEVVKKFGLVNTLDGVDIHVTDGRRYLMYRPKKYNVIISGTSIPSEAMAANLFTKEFYEIAASRLKEGGVFCQHLPAWVLSRNDARACFKTFSSVFENVFIWFVTRSEDMILMGSKVPFRHSPEEVGRRATELTFSVIPMQWKKQIQTEGLDIRKVFNIGFVGDERAVMASSQDVPVITDDWPIVEFSVTRNLLRGSELGEVSK